MRSLRLLLALAVLQAICLLNTFDRALTGALGEPLRHEWGLEDRQLGAAFGVFLVAYAVGVLPAGWLADRYPRRKVLAIAVAAWSLLTTMGGMAHSFPAFLATRAGVGFAEGAFIPAASSLVASLVPGASRGRAMSFVLAGIPLGIGASFWGGAALTDRFGWRTAFLVAVWPGLACAAAVWAIAEPAREPAAAQGPRPGVMKELFRLRSYRGLVLANVLYGFATFGLATFAAPFAIRCLGIPLVLAGQAVAFVSAIGPIVGLAAGGFLADRLSRTRADAPVLLAAIMGGLAAPLFAFTFGTTGLGLYGFAGIVSVAQLLMFPFWSFHQVAIHAVVPADRRGIAVAASGLAGAAIGGGTGPLLMGRLSDAIGAATGSPARGLAMALLAVPVALLLHSLVLAASMRAMREDAERAKAA